MGWRLRNALLTCLALWGCGEDGSPSLPAVADAAVDASVIDAPVIDAPVIDVTPDLGADTPDDTLLADASDAISDALGCIEGKTCVGAPLPTWQLQDFQPQSPRYLQTYGLDGFEPKVTVVALLSGW